MISAFTNSFKIPELRQRILFTLAMVVVVRIGASITAPMVNAAVIRQWFLDTVNNQAGGSMPALLNIFSGGALANCAIFSLGVMPYISASIMLQLLTAVFPRLNKLSREDGGRQKIMQYTRYATILLCIIQGYLLALSFENPETNPFLQGITETIKGMGMPLVVGGGGFSFRLLTVIAMTAGTMLLMWFGDQITDRGIGNGMSMIIMVGIVGQLPSALISAWKTFVPSSAQASAANPIMLVIMVGFFVVVTAAVIAVTQAQRKVPVHYAKRQVGRKMTAPQTTYMPLKVNYAGVMPIIFAQALLMFPGTILNMAFPTSDLAKDLAHHLSRGPVHYTIYGVTIFFFSYFWVATQFQPVQIADDLKRYNGYIPGYRPGKPTSDFLDYSMTRLTFAGALFLTIIAILPQMLAEMWNIPYMAAQFFGGTGLLIVVGVVLDTMRQIETYLLQRHYDGFLRKGKIRGRNQTIANRGETMKQSAMIWLYVGIGIIIIGGVAALISMR